MPTPDFERLRTALLLRGEPDRVPLVEAGVEREIKEAFLGRPLRSLADEVEFWAAAGYDYVPVTVGLRRMFWPGYATSESSARLQGDLTTSLRSRYGLAGADRERAWAQEGQGVIASASDLAAFPWPTADELVDEPMFAELERLLPSGMKAIAYVGYVYTPVWWLMGFEGFCTALADDPDLVARLFEKVGGIQWNVFRRLLEIPCVGAIWHPDDIAYTEGLIVSPGLLRRHLFPWYRRMGDACRDRGIPYLLHTDGGVSAVLDDIVACGFNALHPIEPKAMDIVDVKRRYGARLCLIGNIDLGYTLTRGTPEEVDAEVRERIRVLAPGGGYCVSSSNSVTEYVPFANYQAMRQAVLRYGRYPIRL